MRPVKQLFVLFILFGLASCATLDQFVDPPRVSITNIEVLPSEGFQPRFAIYLNILNPNPVSIPVTGLSYDITLNGYDIFNGATSDIPALPAYEEVPLRVEVGTNLLQSVGFVTGLISGKFDTLDYSIDSAIKVSGIMRPLQVSESGQVALTQ